MKSWLCVGAKVVCVDAGESEYVRSVPLTLGGIYTIESIKCDPNGDMFVRLAEYTSPDGGGYLSHRFQPVINTDAAITAMRDLMQRAVKTQRVDA